MSAQIVIINNVIWIFFCTFAARKKIVIVFMRTFILFALAAVAVSCGRPVPSGSDAEEDYDSLSVLTPTYRSDIYDQGKSEACWIYAFCACVEHETALRADSVLLSRQWLMSHLMKEQTLERYEILSTEHVGALVQEGGRGTLSMRGVGPDVVRLIDTYGLVPYQQERSRIDNSRVLQRKLSLLVSNAVARRQTLQQLEQRMESLLPCFTVMRHRKLTHDLPDSEEESFYYLSMRYTPYQFAESVMYYQHWQWYASEETHLWGERFALEVPDNRRYHEYVNVPMPRLLAMVKESLKQGHAVYWEYGREPSRQKQGGGAASDHAVAIVGMTSDGFLYLNSYGKKWGRGGYGIASEEYFIRHTCNVGIIEVDD